ncbi:MAG TPA: EAL domain-containing protein [Spirochaetia bacterium]|nr:EAL domain-containing protein [Spirochaetia bacterium]
MPDKYEYIVNRSGDFITLINREYVYEIVNDTYCETIGKKRSDVLHRSVPEIWGADRFESTIKPYLDRCFSGESVHYLERFKFGLEQRYMHVSYYPFSERGAETTHALVFSHDVTKMGEIEAKLMNYEYRDPLTGLFNRRSLEILLDMELEKARRARQERLRALLFIGVENLTEVNRQYGHGIGNVLLENTGLRIKECIRNSDYVFRFEGSELVVILSFLARETDAAKVAEKIVESVSTPYRYRENDISLVCRVGVALYPGDADNRDSLIRCSIAALNEAVRRGKDFLLFDPGMHDRAVQRLFMEGHLRHAFECDQFELYFQPILRADRTVEGAEALIRWRLPGRGTIVPGEFLPLAVESGVINAIGRWVLFAAVREIGRIQDRYPIYIAVNMTASDFEDTDFPDVVRSAIEQKPPVIPGRLKIEITESECMNRPDMAVSRIRELNDLGVEVYVDDFGTGQSSLSYLKNLPASTLKIDRTFVDALIDHPEDLSFIENIVTLVKSRGKRVIAEGVTSERQAELLLHVGCNALQGFLFSEPLPAARFEQFLNEHFCAPGSAPG